MRTEFWFHSACWSVAPISAIATIIRSKNSGPFELIFDTIFDGKATYERVKSADILGDGVVCRLVHVKVEDTIDEHALCPCDGVEVYDQAASGAGQCGRTGHFRNTAASSFARYHGDITTAIYRMSVDEDDRNLGNT